MAACPARALASCCQYTALSSSLHMLCPRRLYYAAMLRLPRHMPRQDKLRRVEAVTTALGLRTCQDTIIGKGSGQLVGMLHRCM